MKGRPPAWVALVAAVLALLSVAARDLAAGFHHHGVDEEHGQHDERHPCGVCAVVHAGTGPPPTRQIVTLPAKPVGAAEVEDERAPVLILRASAQPRGPPLL